MKRKYIALESLWNKKFQLTKNLYHNITMYWEWYLISNMIPINFIHITSLIKSVQHWFFFPILKIFTSSKCQNSFRQMVTCVRGYNCMWVRSDFPKKIQNSIEFWKFTQFWKRSSCLETKISKYYLQQKLFLTSFENVKKTLSIFY